MMMLRLGDYRFNLLAVMSYEPVTYLDSTDSKSAGFGIAVLFNTGDYRTLEFGYSSKDRDFFLKKMDEIFELRKHP